MIFSSFQREGSRSAADVALLSVYHRSQKNGRASFCFLLQPVLLLHFGWFWFTIKQKRAEDSIWIRAVDIPDNTQHRAFEIEKTNKEEMHEREEKRDPLCGCQRKPAVRACERRAMLQLQHVHRLLSFAVLCEGVRHPARSRGDHAAGAGHLGHGQRPHHGRHRGQNAHPLRQAAPVSAVCADPAGDQHDPVLGRPAAAHARAHGQDRVHVSFLSAVGVLLYARRRALLEHECRHESLSLRPHAGHCYGAVLKRLYRRDRHRRDVAGDDRPFQHA